MVKPAPNLIRLASRLDFILRQQSALSQAEIANISGVNQTLVSRALNGELKRETKRVKILIQTVENVYANMRKRKAQIPPVIEEALTGYFAAGGDTDILVKQLDLLRLVRSPLRHAEMPIRKSKDR